jgi:uncharacterized protein (DUF2147 family)
MAWATATLMTAAWAQAHSVSPVGVWRALDDANGEPRMIVRVYAENDEVKATVEQLLNDARGAERRCEKCEGKLRDQPVVGMQILKGLRWKDGDYKGGQLIDIDSGKPYQCSMRVADDGSKLLLRGYSGLSFKNRTWTWLKENPPPAEGQPQ